MARWIKTDGSDIQVSPTSMHFSLEEMCDYVDGYIEAIRLTHRLVMYVNEEGVIQQLPINQKAVNVVRAYRPGYHWPIVGNVLIASYYETGDA